MKVELREFMLLSFLATTIVSISGLLHYWNPNSFSLSNVYGNYNHKIYFFFLVNLVSIISILIYEYTFKDLISLTILFVLGFSYLLVLWISEDILHSFRGNAHLVLALLVFLSTLSYILYLAIKRKDAFLGIIFMVALFFLYRILEIAMKSLNEQEPFSTGVLFEELSLILLLAISAVRRGGYL